jgi:hypothetical protein
MQVVNDNVGTKMPPDAVQRPIRPASQAATHADRRIGRERSILVAKSRSMG